MVVKLNILNMKNFLKTVNACIGKVYMFCPNDKKQNINGEEKIQDIATSIGEFDVSDEDYLFMKDFVANAVYDDYDRLVQLCDALAMPTGFCLLEKRFVDVTIRYGVHTATIDRWKRILEIKEQFENQIGCSIYSLLPGIVENSFR